MLTILRDGPYRYIHYTDVENEHLPLIMTLRVSARGLFREMQADADVYYFDANSPQRTLREWKAIARRRTDQCS